MVYLLKEKEDFSEGCLVFPTRLSDKTRMKA